VSEILSQWSGVVHPVNGPWIVRIGGIAVVGAGRQKQQVASLHRVGLTADVQERPALGTVDQKIVVMVLPVHVMAHGAPIVAERQRVKIPGERMARQQSDDWFRHDVANAVFGHRPL
jgi:hypothetical protein